jgi:hypothetical protein
MPLRKTTDEEKEVFKYLNRLRASGKTNMFGARPYIQKKFGFEDKKAKELLLTWMKVFDATGEYEEIDTDN